MLYAFQHQFIPVCVSCSTCGGCARDCTDDGTQNVRRGEVNDRSMRSLSKQAPAHQIFAAIPLILHEKKNPPLSERGRVVRLAAHYLIHVSPKTLGEGVIACSRPYHIYQPTRSDTPAA
jgi:hypothetical protein